MTAFTYHAARDVFSHRPERKVQLLGRGEFFFQPDAAMYEGLRIESLHCRGLEHGYHHERRFEAR
jgi:hypothetical protein